MVWGGGAGGDAQQHRGADRLPAREEERVAERGPVPGRRAPPRRPRPRQAAAPGLRAARGAWAAAFCLLLSLGRGGVAARAFAAGQTLQVPGVRAEARVCPCARVMFSVYDGPRSDP